MCNVKSQHMKGCWCLDFLPNMRHGDEIIVGFNSIKFNVSNNHHLIKRHEQLPFLMHFS